MCTDCPLLTSTCKHLPSAVLGKFSSVKLNPPFPQEPRHLQLLGGLEESSVFSLIAGRKQYGAPTDYGFCIKVPHPCPVWGLPLLMASHRDLGMKP